MAIKDNFLKFMHLNDEEDDYYDAEDEYYDEEDAYEEDDTIIPLKKAVNSTTSSTTTETFGSSTNNTTAKFSQYKTSTSSVSRTSSNHGMEIHYVRPRSIEDAKEITDMLRNSVSVVLNLEELDVEIAQRIIDFSSGSCYALDGKLQKLSRYIFILTPKTVDILGDFQDAVSTSYEGPSSSFLK